MDSQIGTEYLTNFLDLNKIQMRNIVAGRTKESLVEEIQKIFDISTLEVETDDEKEFEVTIEFRKHPGLVKWTLFFDYHRDEWTTRVESGNDWFEYSMPTLYESVGINRTVATRWLQQTIDNINLSTKNL